MVSAKGRGKDLPGLRSSYTLPTKVDLIGPAQASVPGLAIEMSSCNALSARSFLERSSITIEVDLQAFSVWHLATPWSCSAEPAAPNGEIVVAEKKHPT